MASLELRGKYWHLRYRDAGGESRCESTKCIDRREAAKYMASRLKELPEVSLAWERRRATGGRKPGVYFLYSAHTKLTKIGFTSDIDVRVRGLLSMTAEPLELIAAVPCSKPRGLEKAIHQQFDACRRHGEWFALNGLAMARAIGFAIAFVHTNEHGTVASRREMPPIAQNDTADVSVNTAI
jgi:hypothetical protein